MKKLVYVASVKDDDALIYGYGSGVSTEVFNIENDAKRWLYDFLMNWLNNVYETSYKSISEMLKIEDDHIYWEDGQLIHLDDDEFKDEFKGSYEQRIIN